jgi:hypothetical protein
MKVSRLMELLGSYDPDEEIFVMTAFTQELQEIRVVDYVAAIEHGKLNEKAYAAIQSGVATKIKN